MTNLEITTQRLANQHLTTPTFEKPDEVVAALGAVQAQDYAGAKWALAQRMKGGSTDAALDEQFNKGTILRTHLSRPTWHFVTPADIRWMLELTAPRVNAFNAFMYRKLELDDAVFKKSNAVISKALRGGKQKARAELASELERAGISTKDGVRLGYLVMRAELEGVVCSGARKGKQFTYALLEERAPPVKKLKRDEALYELTRRYFLTRGPATAQDFVWWSGLTMADAKKGIEMCASLFEKEQIGEQIFWFRASAPLSIKKAPTAYLLPNYDEYFIGYKDRSAIGERVQARTPEELNRALFVHIIFVNGQIVGGWRRTLKKDSVRAELDLLAPLTKTEARAVADAAGEYAKFLGLALELAEKAFDGKREVGLFS